MRWGCRGSQAVVVVWGMWGWGGIHVVWECYVVRGGYELDKNTTMDIDVVSALLVEVMW